MRTTLFVELCVHILTWNLGKHCPLLTRGSLSALLPNNEIQTHCPNGHIPDIFVIGLQEFRPTFFKTPVTSDVTEHLKEYFLVDKRKFEGMFIMVFINQKHKPFVRDVESTKIRSQHNSTHGAVSVRINLYGAGIAFINSQLADSVDDLHHRICEYSDISNNQRFTVKGYQHIKNHEFVFWFGDLHFQLGGKDKMIDKEVSKGARYKRTNYLLKYDELRLAQKDGRAFKAYAEQTLLFKPTCTLFQNINKYVPSIRPAYCDRILFKIPDKSKGLRVGSLHYDSHMNSTGSQHRPVSATFKIRLNSELGQDHDLYGIARKANKNRFKTSWWKRTWNKLYPPREECLFEEFAM